MGTMINFSALTQRLGISFVPIGMGAHAQPRRTQ